MANRQNRTSSDLGEWKDRFNNVIKICQKEIKRTTVIGKKMLNASKTNAGLNQTYQEMGRLVAQEMESGNLNWDHSKAQELLALVKSYRHDLQTIEEEVKSAKEEDQSLAED